MYTLSSTKGTSIMTILGESNLRAVLGDINPVLWTSYQYIGDGFPYTRITSWYIY